METIISENLGSFEGFNHTEKSSIGRTLSAQQVLAWDTDCDGEAEFWPAGDCPGVELLFRGQSAVTAQELIELDGLVARLGGPTTLNFLRIHYAVDICGKSLYEVTVEEIENQEVHIYIGTGYREVRFDAAHALFARYWPDLHQAWKTTNCPGLRLNVDDFLNPWDWTIHLVDIGEEVALLITSKEKRP